MSTELQESHCRMYRNFRSLHNDTPEYVATEGEYVTDSGAWSLQSCDTAYFVDLSLAWGIARFVADDAHRSINPMDFSNSTGKTLPTILELGAGCGCYSNIWRRIGFNVTAYDGIPEIARLSYGAVDYADLATTRHNFTHDGDSHALCEEDSRDCRPNARRRRYDWSVSLEVAEHIPPAFEKTYLANILHNVRRGVIMSWAQPGQGDHKEVDLGGHVNEQHAEYAIQAMYSRGFIYDADATLLLRAAANTYWCCVWFSHNILVFRRRGVR